MAAPKGNKFAVGNSGGTGREPLYNDPAEMQKKIDAYFNTEKIWTVPGLALALGFCATQSLINYANKSEVFSYSIRRAKLRIEDFTAKQLFIKGGPGATGLIFVLKNLGWADSQSIDVTTNLANLTDDQLIFITNQLIEKQNANNNKG